MDDALKTRGIMLRLGCCLPPISKFLATRKFTSLCWIW